MSTHSQVPWVIFRLRSSLVGVCSTFLREIVPLSDVTELPKAAAYIRGVISLRGKFMPVIDTRVLFGMQTLRSECNDMVEMLKQREQDHLKWLAELDACVREKRKFCLSRDPHKCAFGRWYDSFKTDNNVWQMMLQKFSAPHKAVHAVADSVLELLDDGRESEALARIEQARRHELRQMLDVFHLFQEQACAASRELAVIIEYSGEMFAISADSVDSAEPLKAMEPVPALVHGDRRVIAHIGRRNKDDALILLVDLEVLLEAIQHAA